MFERFIRFLITILVIGLCCFLFLWVLGILGIVIPHTVLVILGAIVVLIIILIAWRFFGAYLGNPLGPLPPPR